MGDDDPVPPDETAWWRESTTTPDGRRALQVFVAQTAVISARAAALDRVALAAATTDPEVGEVIAHHERLRESGFRAYVDTLADRGLLRHGLDAPEATDVLLTLCGSEVFLGFTEDRGWEVERYATWTAGALSTLLLGA